VNVVGSRRSEPAWRGTSPALSGCQSSTSASSTVAPTPSYIAPCSRIACGWPGSIITLSPGNGSPRSRNGPTVCPGVQADSVMFTLGRGSRAAGQHDVPPVPGRVFRLGEVVVVAGDQPLACDGIEDRLKDRVQ